MMKKQTLALTGITFALSLVTSFAAQCAQEAGNPPAMQEQHRHHAMHHGSAGPTQGSPAPGMRHQPGTVAEMGCHGGAQSASPMTRGGGMGGMMHGPGMMGMGGASGMHDPAMMEFRALSSLDLTDEQREQIATIHDELHKQHWSLRGSMFDDQSKLRRLYAAQPRDAKAIGASYGHIFDVRRQMIEATIEASNRAAAVLTEEQREQLEPVRR